MGKTALALHWANRAVGAFPDGQLYVNLRGFDPGGKPVAPEAALRGFLAALGVPGNQTPTTREALVNVYRCLLARKRILVVLDNAAGPEQVRPLLPAAPGCAALITSRDELRHLVAVEDAKPLALGLLSAAEAVALLAARLGADRIAAEPAAADEIVTACARLPLALVVTAARAALAPEVPLAVLARELAPGGRRAARRARRRRPGGRRTHRLLLVLSTPQRHRGAAVPAAGPASGCRHRHAGRGQPRGDDARRGARAAGGAGPGQPDRGARARPLHVPRPAAGVRGGALRRRAGAAA